MRIINFIPALTLGLLISLSSNAQKKTENIDFSKLMKDIAITKASTHEIEAAIWMPTIYWEVVARDNPNFTTEVVEQIKSLVDDYVIVCYVKTKLNDNTLSFEPILGSALRKKLVLEFNEKSYKPLYYNDLPDDVQKIKDILEPMFSKMLGELGSGMNVLFFEVKDREGNNLIDPSKNGSFSLKYEESLITYNLPLPSLCEDKICKTDDVIFPGNYVFCPFHGTKLEVVKE